MAPRRESPPRKLETFREYLRLLAQLQLPTDIQVKLDASDFVQETLLKAHENWDQFQGSSDRALAAWLRTILSNQLADAVRRFGAAKRDAGLELSLDRALEDSALRLKQLLAVGGAAPHDRAIREEDLLELSAALAQLPEDQRKVVEWKYLQDLSVSEIGERLGRGKTAVSGLLRRGMTRLRKIFEKDP